MKNIYVSHSRGYDFVNELYRPLRESALNDSHKIILPHETSEELFSSKEFFKNKCDALVVEASYPKLGVGIEVGWADAFDVPIITMYKQGFKLSKSIAPMGKVTFDYSSKEDMISQLGKALEKI